MGNTEASASGVETDVAYKRLVDNPEQTQTRSGLVHIGARELETPGRPRASRRHQPMVVGADAKIAPRADGERPAGPALDSAGG